MDSWWPVGALVLIVTGVLLAPRQSALQRLFRWLPLPLWCYALPLAAVSLGWLPAGHSTYRTLTDHLLPLALVLLLLGIDLVSVLRAGAQALVAAVVGAVGIIAGTAFGVWWLHAKLPQDAWTGAGSLAGTWTGGTMNLLALRSILGTPEGIFAPLIVVDAVIAYSWMALLVAASGFQDPINRWLRSAMAPAPSASHQQVQESLPIQIVKRAPWGSRIFCLLLALGVTVGARLLASYLPTSQFVSSSMGWTVLLVTTVALGVSLIPPLRQVGAHGAVLGYPALYLVLAATGAQAGLEALRQAPVWLLVGLFAVLLHGALLVLAGRLLRIPLALLATASQANIGGVVSAPLVGAVYRRELAPVGLLLAVAGNALGTYCGLASALLARWLTG